MSEYIDRAALKQGLAPYEENDFSQQIDVILDIVDAQPAADVVEVRHGRWIPSDMGGGEPDEAYICSECGEPWVLNDGTPEENNMRYCPACGARMGKEEEHEVG